MIIDISTFAMFMVLMGIGFLLGSVAMQWIGGLLGIVVCCSRALVFLDDSTCTIEEAEARLKEMKDES